VTSRRSGPPPSPTGDTRSSVGGPSLAEIAAGCRRLAELYVRQSVLRERWSEEALRSAWEAPGALGPLGGKLGDAIAVLTTNPRSLRPDELVAACNAVTHAALHADPSPGTEAEAGDNELAMPERSLVSARLAPAKVSVRRRQDDAGGVQLAFPGMELL
jgi:hypothetical protein